MRLFPFGPGWWFALAATLTSPVMLFAAPPSSVYPDDSDAAETQIRSAQANVRDKQWAEAAEIYRVVLSTFGDKAIRLPDEYRRDKDFVGESRRWVNVREFVLAEMVQWPEEGRKAFAQRTDPEAERIWRRAAARETAPEQARAELTKLATEFYLGSYGARAIERLGDVAFAAGDFEEAAGWYARLVVLPGSEPRPEGVSIPAVHPAPNTEKAVIAAKLVLSRSFAGTLGGERLEATLKAFAAAYPEARGNFAGRTGPIAESLTAAVRSDLPKSPVAPSTDWPTFAGSPTRNFVVDDSIDLGDRQWRTPIDSIVQGPARFQGQNRFGGFGGRGMFPRNFPANPNRQSEQLLLAYHPVIVDEQVIISTELGVRAYNLNESPKPDEPVRPLWSQDFDRVGRNNNPQQTMSSSAPRMTLTARSGRLFARLGESGINLEFGNRMAPSNAFIVALDFRNKGQVIWRLQGSQIELPQPDGNAAPLIGSIEGTPVADDDRLYLAMTLPGHQTSTYIVALDAGTGRTLWTRYVCDTPNPFDFQAAMLGYQATHAHHLLTLVDGRLFYQSDTGAVACLDALTGQLRWLTAYPKREQLGNAAIPPTRRDLNPVIYEGGQVYVAPGDSQNVFALDAETGEVKWKSAPLPDVIHLIGVADGNLFATGDRVWTIEAATGRILRSWPDTGSGYEPSGRGILAGRYLYWPTSSEIHILDLKTGLRSDRGTIRLRERFGTSGGNLALGDGFLVVAGADSLSAFTQNTRLIRRYEQLIASAPESAGPRYRLATAAESLGQIDLALQSLREALKRIEPGDRLDGQDLDRLIRDRLFRLLLERARKAESGQDKVRMLAEAASVAPLSVQKLAAAIRRAEALGEMNQVAEAIASLSEAARDATTLDGLWPVETRYEANVTDLARRTLGTLWGMTSEERRAQHERQELRRLEPIAAAGDRPALLAFLAGSVPGEARARALLALSRTSERTDDPTLARHRLAQAEVEPGVPADLLAEIRRERQTLAPRAAASNESTAWPLAGWKLVKSEFRQIVPVVDPARNSPDGPGADSMIFGIGRDGSTRLLDTLRGQPGPVLEGFAGAPIWAGVTAGRGLIFDGESLWGLDPLSGRVVWRISLRETDIEDPRYSPFAAARSAGNPLSSEKRTSGGNGSEAVRDASWWSIDADQGRITLFRYSGQIWQVDATEGRLLWKRSTDSSRSPDDGQAPAAIPVGKYVLVREGTSLQVLDGESGEAKRSIDSSIAGSDWPRKPLSWDDGRIVLAPDRMSLAMIDLNEGKRVWTWKATTTSPRNGPPRMFRHGDRLVAIRDGDMAVRLDPADGRPLWDVFLGGSDHSREQTDIALDDTRLYVIEPLESSRIPGVVTRAFDLTDGSQAWRSVHISAGQAWSVTAGIRGQGAILVRPGNVVTHHFALGIVQGGEPLPVAPSGTFGESVPVSAVVLERGTGRPRWRYAAPIDDDMLWTVADPAGQRLYWGSYRDASAALVVREP